MSKIKVVIAGVGNYAGTLIHGVHFYHDSYEKDVVVLL